MADLPSRLDPVPSSTRPYVSPPFRPSSPPPLFVRHDLLPMPNWPTDPNTPPVRTLSELARGSSFEVKDETFDPISSADLHLMYRVPEGSSTSTSEGQGRGRGRGMTQPRVLRGRGRGRLSAFSASTPGKAVSVISSDRSSLSEDSSELGLSKICLLYTSPSPRDLSTSRMPSSA